MNKRSYRAVQQHGGSAVLVDGSTLYLAARSYDRPLDYQALIGLLVEKIPYLGKPGEPDTLWTMWTAASAQNEGQIRFLEFAERDLRWEVRRVAPVDSYIIEPAVLLGWSSGNRSASPLMRFDASLAFAIGRLAEQHRPLVVVTDSFALADPLRRADRIASGVYLAFFGTAVDARWQGVLRREKFVEFIDFDEHADRLFGIPRSPPEVRSTEGEVIY